MSVFDHVLYVWLITLGMLDMLLVTPALRRAEHDFVTQRLLSTIVTLAGLVLASTGRLVQNDLRLPLPSTVGVILIDLGLLGYALFLPEHGLLGLIRRARNRRRP